MAACGRHLQRPGDDDALSQRPYDWAWYSAKSGHDLSGLRPPTFCYGLSGTGQGATKFNGGIFTVEPKFCNPQHPGSPDWRLWGDGYWYQNTRHLYHPMLAAGDFDFMTPFFALYERSLPLARARAKSWYGAEGTSFPKP